MNQKTKIARLSVISNAALILMKISVGLLSGSVSIISEAIHSAMDLIASVIAYFSVSVSDNPPDDDHPYGHGKFENVSGVIEALLIFIAAFWIIYEAIHKIINPTQVNNLGIGVGSLVMFISATINLIVSRKLYRVAKLTESIALEADALHLKTDVYTSFGVGVGLLLIWTAGLTILDPVIAILVAVYILKESYILLTSAFYPLLDSALPKEDITKIHSLLLDMNVHYHDLKTRRAGSQKFVDFHMEMPSKTELGDAHRLCDDIEKMLNENLPHIRVNIHVEPLDKD